MASAELSRRVEKVVGYSGLCPRVVQSGESDRRGALSKHGPTYLRWALIEATMHALRHPVYSARYQRTKRRLGKQRGAKVPISPDPPAEEAIRHKRCSTRDRERRLTLHHQP